MEIKRVNGSSINYPKKEEVTEEVLKENLLEKWYIAGISSLIIYGLLENDTYGFESQDAPLAGDVMVVENTLTNSYNNTTLTNCLSLDEYNKGEAGTYGWISLISAILILLILLNVYVDSKKAKLDESKKEDEGEK